MTNDVTTTEPVGGFDRRLTSYGDPGLSKFLRRAFLASSGLDGKDLAKPVVGICNTASDYTTCHRDMPALMDAVKRGVLEAGGLPFQFTAMSLGEILMNPTTMMFRNLMAMEVEEQITAQPMDAVVLLGGCDKTVPAELMAAASADIPAIALVVGPMMTGSWRGERLGACTDCRRMWTDFRGDELNDDEVAEVNAQLCPTAGTCMVMGTASTMGSVLEALGMTLPRAGTAPAVSSERLRLGVSTGRRAVELIAEDLRPSQILTRESFHNALVTLSALSGSTNAIIHLTAIARRLGITLDLQDFHRAAEKTPVLVDCKPAGSRYLPDFHVAGGMPTLLKELETLLERDTLTITGKTMGEQLDVWEPAQPWQDMIRTLDDPLKPAGALVALSGSLFPDGAVIKAAAASPDLMKHRGRAVVFESLDDVEARLEDPSLNITPDDILVLRNIGPAATGMPEAGAIPIPKHLARRGVRDMVRVSDGRMSGTAYGTVVLHGAPESARGGPIALVRDGDEIELDVEAGRIDLLVDENELERRRAATPPLPAPPARGWRRLYAERVLQADQGADLDFL
ncbi:dihydroxy-acid dehydratase [Solicola sp. PLA-1-18]|uniref:dihydroxy-acid dehydratase n=1 Tax=Solicola sp. PLA-1-18 TaxID=3380532 RepID=UPI003B7CF3FE